MQLPGRLSASTLGDLLGALHREQITGLLELAEIRGPHGRTVPGRRHTIHLRQGLVASVETGLPVPRLGEILRREGLVGSTVLAWLLRRLSSGDDRAAGEILIRDGFAQPEIIRLGLRKQLAERLDAVFALDEATVTFHTARPLPRSLVRVDPLAPRDFLHGRPRRRDRPPPSSGSPPSSGGSPRSSGSRGSTDRSFSSAPASSASPPNTANDPLDQARKLLGIAGDASPAEVRRAFRKIAVSLHPDRADARSREERQRNAERFARLSAAYHALVL